MMLDLDSSRWQELRACGEDGRIVARLIRQVTAGDEDQYAELLHETCHQGSVYSAAYAAVPHLVALAGKINPADRLWPLFIAGMIALASHEPYAAKLPDDLAGDYKSSLTAAIPLTTECLSQGGWKRHDLRALLSCLAAFHGAIELASVLERCDGYITCPTCGTDINVMESELNLLAESPASGA